EAQIAHHQYFKVSPQPEVNVIEGTTLELQCVVGNQRGPVQWAKDGFLLGYDRNIPGYPRYSMVGEASVGVHNLKIENVQGSIDTGTFDCQVGPGGKNYAPIRATSKVTVLIPPNSIEITAPSKGKNVLKNASHVEIQEGGSVTIECLVTGGKPPAQIKWFRKSVELRADSGSKQESTTMVTTMVDSNSIQESESVVYTSKSSITVSGNAEDNGVPYTCEAIHPALTGRPLRRTVSLSVLYPPGEPEISGYVYGEILKVGDTIKLDCRSRGGNPLAQLVWFRNDEQVDFSYTTVAGKYSINTLEFTVEARDNNAVYRCVATSPIMERSMSKETKLQVFFGPSKLSINSVRDVRAGDVVTVSCRTEPSNPAAMISWVVDGRPIVHDNSTVEPTNGGGFITTANITIVITNQDRNMKMLSCYAVNEKISETIVESSVLNVLYPPESIHIFGYDEGKALHHETIQRLTCVCNGGNPLCTPKWLKGDKEITEGTKFSVNGNTVTNELALRVDPSDNGVMYKCTGENNASSSPIKAITTLTVHFPPNKVTIKLTPKQPVAGSQLDISCETGSSNPQSVVSWWRDGFQLTGHQDAVIDGLYGGKTTRNILRLNVTSQDDGTVITCQDAPEFLNPPLTQFDIIEGQSNVFNQTARGNPSSINYKWKREDDSEIGNSGSRLNADGPILNVSNAQRSDSGIYKLYATNELGTSETSIRVNVQYPAVIKKTTEMVLVEEFSNAHLECYVDSNPVNERVIQWVRRKNETEIVPINGSEEDDESYYNRMRSDLELFNDDNQQQSGHVVDDAKMKSSLLIMNATLQDSGTSFDCIADNGIGKAAKSTLTLLVLHKPVIDRSPIISKSASESGSSAKLICRAQGTPNVTFTWKREGSVIEVDSTITTSSSGSSSSTSTTKSLSSKSRSSKTGKISSSTDFTVPKYELEETKQLDLITYQSVLIVNDVSHSDYGSYDCIARNELGFDAFAIVLNRTSRPDSPRTLRVVNVTSGSVTLRWMAGFDGGLRQTFRLRYRAIGSNVDEHYSYRDVSNVTMFVLNNLRDNTDYVFGVMATNDKGDSDYSSETVQASTLKESGITETEKIISKVLENGGELPRLIFIVTLVGSSLLLFNVVLVVCFVRKKRLRKRYEEESDGYSGGTDSKTTASSKATMELYETTTNGTKPSTVSLNHMGLNHHKGGINETSISGGEDELISNKSDDRFSGQTDYEMEIPPASMMTLDNHHHHHLSMLPNGLHIQTSMSPGTIGGMSTYLIDESSANLPPPPLNYPNNTTIRYSSLGSDIGGPTSFYNAIANEEDYLNALQHSGGQGTLLTTAGQLAALNSVGGQPMPLQINAESGLTMSHTAYGNLSDIHQAYMVAGDVSLLATNVSNGNGLVPPLPPLRSIMPGNGSMTTFLPAITEEPPITPIGHLV
ncbi:hypothetical protein RDWZM_009166, partial [Blomia tropicalis]